MKKLFQLKIAVAAVLMCCTCVCAESDSGLKPGPLLKERTQLKQKLDQAKAQGIGTSGYEAAFASVEQAVGANISESDINSKISSLSTALDAQLDRAKTLKSQHPLAPVGGHGGGFRPLGTSPGSAPRQYGKSVTHTSGDTMESISAKIKESQQRDADLMRNAQQSMDSPEMRALVKNVQQHK